MADQDEIRTAAETIAARVKEQAEANQKIQALDELRKSATALRQDLQPLANTLKTKRALLASLKKQLDAEQRGAA